ncbi:MAG: hypothetical protein P4L10_10930 [Acidobacteriaceae bacterium]|nr:hypothetical protein [Acidobacteriaceae bacterium]
MSDMSILGFIAKVSDMTIAVHEAGYHALERAAVLVEKEAKSSIGTYQSAAGPFAAWAELADATKADRVRQGYTENDPELRDGTMRDGIEHTVVMRGFDGEAHIGSDDPILAYQELGTSKMPPRSILGGALFREADKVAEIIGHTVYGALIGEEVFAGSIPVIGDGT